MLGLPKPDPDSPIHVDEEALFERFLEVWRKAPDEDAPIRAARLLAQGARAAMLGWADLVDEQIAEPVRQRLFRGELEEFPDDVRVSFMRVTNLVPEMFTWLSSRYLEHRSVNGIVEGFERFLAHEGLAPTTRPGRARPRSCSSTCRGSHASPARPATSPPWSRRHRSSATPMPRRPVTAGGS